MATGAHQQHNNIEKIFKREYKVNGNELEKGMIISLESRGCLLCLDSLFLGCTVVDHITSETNDELREALRGVEVHSLSLWSWHLRDTGTY